MENQSTPLKGPSVKKFIPGIAWFLLVLVLICLPGTDLPTVETWLNDIYFDKWDHTGLFAVLTFLFIYPFTRSSLTRQEKKNTAVKITIAAVIWGLTTELIQKFFIPDRSFDIADLGANSLGALIAYFWCSKKYLN
jgi:VanZ family protein